MTFVSPSWRSLNLSKRSLNHPKKVTLNHLVDDIYKTNVPFASLGCLYRRRGRGFGVSIPPCGWQQDKAPRGMAVAVVGLGKRWLVVRTEFLHPLKQTWNLEMMVKPIGISFSKGPFSGSMFVFGGVLFKKMVHFFLIMKLKGCFFSRIPKKTPVELSPEKLSKTGLLSGLQGMFKASSLC